MNLFTGNSCSSCARSQKPKQLESDKDKIDVRQKSRPCAAGLSHHAHLTHITHITVPNTMTHVSIDLQ